MSPRAACRLEQLGFSEVYDYVAGKVDWLANALPVEGEHPDAPVAGRVMRDDAVTCRPEDRVGDVREQIGASPYPFALVVSPERVLVGRLRRSSLDCDPALTAEEVMEPGPSTVRPHRSAASVAERLAERELRWAIVTTPEGRLLGIASREELESLS